MALPFLRCREWLRPWSSNCSRIVWFLFFLLQKGLGRPALLNVKSLNDELPDVTLCFVAAESIRGKRHLIYLRELPTRLCIFK